MATAKTYYVKPTPGRIVVKPLAAAKMTVSNIHIPDTATFKPTQGEVICICDPYILDGQDMEPIFKLGDLVVFGKYTGTEIQVGRDKIVICRERDILGVFVEGTYEDVGSNSADLKDFASRVKVTERDAV